MSGNKLVDESRARAKQLEDMHQMHRELLHKLRSVEQGNAALALRVGELTATLDSRSATLQYILEEKEATFNKLQLAIVENEELKKTRPRPAEPAKKKGLFSSLVGYFRADSLGFIDVSQGKVRKSDLALDSRQLVREFNKPESIFSHDLEVDALSSSPQPLNIAKMLDSINDNSANGSQEKKAGPPGAPTQLGTEQEEAKPRICGEGSDTAELGVESDENPEHHLSPYYEEGYEMHEGQNLQDGAEEFENHEEHDEQSADVLKLIREIYDGEPE